MELARTGVASIFHAQSEVLVSRSTASKRCAACTRHRKSLASLASRATNRLSDDRTHPSSHTRYSVLTSPEKDERLHRLHSEARKSKQQFEHLRQRVVSLIDKGNVTVDDELDDDLQKMVSEHESEIKTTYPEGSFQRVFWDEQVKASTFKDKRSMKWHPMFIRWCLYLRHVSGKAYEVLQNSGCIRLPSQRTLRDYTHYVSAKIGFCV